MPELVWQKSSYSAEAANCVYVAAAPTGTVHLRESDAPDTVLITTRPRLHDLIRTLKAHPAPHTASARTPAAFSPRPSPADPRS